MALVDTRFNSYQPNLTVLASNNVIKLGSVISVDVRSTLSPGNVIVKSGTQQYNARVPISSVIPNNFGSTTNASIYIEGAIPYESSNATYKTFSVTEKIVQVIEDTPKPVKLNPIVTASVVVNIGQVTMNVTTVVVEEESKIYGYRIPYRNDSILVDINDVNVSADRKPVRLSETYVYVKDNKNELYRSTYTADGSNITKVSIDKLDETKRVKMQGIASKLAVPTRRTAVVIETKIKPVNVIDESIPGSGGGGGGGGGAGVLTEYWS